MSLNVDAIEFNPGAPTHEASSRFARPEDDKNKKKRRRNNRGRGRGGRGRGRGRGRNRGGGKYNKHNNNRGGGNNNNSRDGNNNSFRGGKYNKHNNRSYHRKKNPTSMRGGHYGGRNRTGPPEPHTPTDDEVNSLFKTVTLPYEIEQKGEARCKELTREILAGGPKCCICVSRVRKEASIWSCEHCFTIFHLDCIKDWAASINKREKPEDRTFTCPACMKAIAKPVFEDRCFCGKDLFPDVSSFLPHGCDNLCSRVRPYGCPHPCPLQCHPGPCPPCRFLGSERKCPCGKSTYQIQCGTTESKPQLCDEMCGKLLRCGSHMCTENCHNGPCPECTIPEMLTCFCGKKTEGRQCGSGIGPDKKFYKCDNVCDKPLNCKNHNCKLLCHEGACPPCDRKTGRPQRCACSKNIIERFKFRRNCLAPMPSCTDKCERILDCKNPDHLCREVCHDSPCQPCRKTIKVVCGCRKSKKMLPCAEAQELKFKSLYGGGYRCNNTCNSKMSCGRHRCPEICCLGRNVKHFEGHLCLERCDKTHPCGHGCDALCHTGSCPSCAIILHGATCTCGFMRITESISCGSIRFDCPQKCSRIRECGHGCNRRCHLDPCSPCHVLMTQWCAGGHREIPCVPCSRTPHCDSPCGRLRRCNIHTCQRPCHLGVCEENVEGLDDDSCGQICGLKMSCGHPCKAPCHPEKDCAPKKCTRKVYVSCPCGTREKRAKCFKKQKIGFLTCDDQCAIAKRNQNFREALQIDTANIGNTEFRISVEVLDAVQHLRYPKQFVENLQDVLRCFVEGRNIPSNIKGFEKIAENKLEINAKLRKNPNALKIITAVAPTYGIRVQTVGTTNYKYITLVKAPKCHLPPILLSEIVANYNDNPTRFRAIEKFPPENILVLICKDGSGSDENLLKEMLDRLDGEGISLDIYRTSDGHLMCYFPDQSMRNAANKKLQNLNKVKQTRKGIEGDAEILFFGGTTEVYSTEEEALKKKEFEREIRREEYERKKREALLVQTASTGKDAFEAENPFDALNANESKI